MPKQEGGKSPQQGQTPTYSMESPRRSARQVERRKRKLEKAVEEEKVAAETSAKKSKRVPKKKSNHHRSGAKTPRTGKYKPYTADSVSAKLRKEGNLAYGSAFKEGIPSVVKMARLEKSLHFYIRAANEADGPTRDGDWSSATKNCGVATKRMAQECPADNKERPLSFYRMSLKYLTQALARGSSCQEHQWEENLKEEIQDVYQDVMEVLSDFDDKKDFLKELYQLSNVMSPGVHLAKAKLDICTTLFKESVKFLEVENFKDSLRCLHDIRQPVEEALQMLRNRSISRDPEAVELTFDLEVVKRDTAYHICTSESIQARKCGEKMLKQVLGSEEYLNMDEVLITLDWFKEASLKAAELDLEQEAAALSFLGLIHQKILFSTTRSKQYYKRCLELVDAARPKTFLTQEWYKQCVEGFRKIQEKERMRDEAAQQKIKDKILESLKEEITALKEANLKGVYSLLEHLYKHHVPSKTPKFTSKHLEDLQKNVDEPSTMTTQKQRKKLLLKACQDFHPDKFAGTVDENESQEDRDKRKVLHEEITKMITKYYEHLKMC
ncbi:uncharacterized protein [Asterias amurensis]|uniref:uncharacterized protein n=1 Tax=Asterias amurensis TaxID=7602 RepID=UPI003AB11BE8